VAHPASQNARRRRLTSQGVKSVGLVVPEGRVERDIERNRLGDRGKGPLKSLGDSRLQIGCFVALLPRSAGRFARNHPRYRRQRSNARPHDRGCALQIIKMLSIIGVLANDALAHRLTRFIAVRTQPN